MKFTATFLFLSSLAISTMTQAEFAISPMMIEFDSGPGIKQPFNFQIHGKKAGKARIFLTDLSQQPSGHMQFIDINEDKKSNDISDWIKLEKTSVKVKKGETLTIGGEVIIPKKTTGNHLIAIMVEEEKSTQDKGININVRYAIILSLQVSGKKTRIVTQFDTLKIEEQNGKNYLSAWFTNKSNRDAMLDSTAFIRDSNRKLVGKIPLKTKSAWQRSDDYSRVFPGAKVQVYGLVSDELTSGNYSITTRSRFAGKMQRSIKSEVAINHINTPTVAENNNQDNAIIHNPVAIRVNKNGRGFSMIKLSNPLDNEIEVILPKDSDIDGIKTSFQPKSVKISARGQTSVVLRQQYTHEAKPSILKAQLIKSNCQKDCISELTITTSI